MILSILILLGLSASGCAGAPPAQAVALSVPSAYVPQPFVGSASNSTVLTVQPGDTLWAIAQAFGLDVEALAAANQMPSSQHLTVGETLQVPLPIESGVFVWPMRGRVKETDVGTGLSIEAASGSAVRASRSGLAAVVTQNLQGWGPTVVLDHQDGYYSVYSGLGELAVRPGVFVRQGSRLGSLGAKPLYFEIRNQNTPRDPLSMLPEA